MAFNPFLMETDYAQQPTGAAMFTYPEPQAAEAAPSSNPFLSFGAEPAQAAPAPTYDYGNAYGMQSAAMPSAGDNPFLSYEASSVPMPAYSAAAASSNPFADFAAPAPAPPSGAAAYYNSTADMGYHHMSVDQQSHQYYQQEPEMQLIDTSDGSGTKNLLESVTGVLEATSSSLLDRLRVSAPSPTPDLPSPRTPSPDLMGSDLDSEPPPVPPPSANPLAPSPLPKEASLIDIFDSKPPEQKPEPPKPVTSTAGPIIDLMGLYNFTPATTTTAAPPPKPEPLITQAPVQVPVSQALVDLVVEPATPLVKEAQKEPEPPKPQPLDTLSPEEKPKAPPEKPPPPRPPSPARSPVMSPVKETQPPPRPSTAPPSRPAPPKSPLPSRPPPPPPAAREPKEPEKVEPAPQFPVSAASPPEIFQQPAPVAAPPPVPVAAPPPVPVAAPPPVPVAAPPPVPVVAPPPVPVAAPPPVPVAAPPPAPVTSPFGPPVAAAPPPTSAGASIFAAKPHLRPKLETVDSFDQKFEQASTLASGKAGFSAAFGGPPVTTYSDAWGEESADGDAEMGFGSSAFDSFLSMTEPPPVPQSTPAKIRREGDSMDDDEEKEMSITIRPRNETDNLTLAVAPSLAPPPKSPALSSSSFASEPDVPSSFVPFLSQSKEPVIDTTYADARRAAMVATGRTDSAESVQTPLYEEDTSQPLEPFPRTQFERSLELEMFMRWPNKKVTFGGNRSWRPVHVKVEFQGEIPIVKIFNKKGDREPIQEIPLQSSYSVSDVSAQQFDQYGKLFTVKVQFVYYKERPGVRPGQIGKASKLSSKLTAFAAYAITGDPSGVKEFGSDLKKLGLPLEHAPQVSQLVKLGTQNYDDIKTFSCFMEETIFRLPCQRDRSLTYKTEEIQVTIVDEYYVEQDVYGVVTRQIARVRVMFLSFLNGMAQIEMGVNDLRRQGKEIVGRHDIIPVPTEEWIRMEDIEFSNLVDLPEFEETQTIKFKPPDASYLELMRFRVRPPRHRELPLQVKTVFITTGQRIEIRSDILVPGYTSRKLGQIPCEDVMVRFPIPETWIYMFRVEKHFRYGSVKSAHRRSGKVKGVERILGALDAVEPSLMETTSGQAKYEHHHRAIVWRIPRLPKEGQGAYTTHSFFCHITLQPHEKIPDNLSRHCYVEFTMPHTTVSHTVCRSISVPTSDEPPEKCCRYLSRHEYLVEIEHKEGVAPVTYAAAAAVEKEKSPEPEQPVRGEFDEQKYDSDFSDD